MEKQLFIKKFIRSTYWNHKYGDYIFHCLLENNKDKTKTFVFINNSDYFLKDSHDKLHSDGVLILRKEILELKGIPYIEINYNEVFFKLSF